MAYRQPGWIFVSTFWTSGFDGTGTPPTPGLLDLENLVADTNTGAVCRVGRHRSWGKANTVLGVLGRGAHRPEPERHARGVRQRLGRRQLASTAYVLELPSYAP